MSVLALALFAGVSATRLNFLDAQIDECGDAGDCSSCLAPSHGGGNCGWCAPTAVEYADGTKGKRCADLRDKSHGGGWQCHGKLMTDQCLPGWICGGEATKYQCVQSATKGEGNPVYADCQAGCTPRPAFKCTDKEKGQCSACADPLDPTCTKNFTKCLDGCVDTSLYSCNPVKGTCEKCDSPGPSCVGKAECSTTCSAMYGCVFPTSVTDKPKCKSGCDPKSQDCKYHSSEECEKGCDWQYKCDTKAVGGAKCVKTKYGIPKKEWCDEQCAVSYTCDEEAKTCNASSTGGGQYTNKTQCDSNCPAKPCARFLKPYVFRPWTCSHHTAACPNQTPNSPVPKPCTSRRIPNLDLVCLTSRLCRTPIVPQELIGVWRGLELHNGFERGEWTANVSEKMFTLYDPKMKVYVSGNSSHRKLSHGKAGETGELWINSTEGTLVGMVKMIYGDSQLDPELSYVSLGVSEVVPSTLIDTYDKGMTTKTDKVFGLTKCAGDSSCKFHLPAVPKPIDSNGEVIAKDFDVAAAFKATALLATTAGNPFATDVCNQFDSCSKCVGATVGDVACGWCTSPVQYNDSSKPKYQCSGSKAGTASGWTCYGIYRTLSCYDYACDPVSKQCKQQDPGSGGPSYPTKGSCERDCKVPHPWGPCYFDGVYRGIQIDLNYPKGEWDANFTEGPKFTTANFTFVPSGYTYAGKVQCRNPTSPTKVTQMGEFKLSLINGTDLFGLYQVAGNQAETEGLSWALSNLNVTAPPDSFKSAMPGLNSSVYAYTKCASYKKGICIF